MKTLSIMQPYFMPYAGYFRLFSIADCVVLLDCVQFPRRGWVHRNKLPLMNGDPAWLTLPLVSHPRETMIREISFHPSANDIWPDRLRRFPSLHSHRSQPPVSS